MDRLLFHSVALIGDSGNLVFEFLDGLFLLGDDLFVHEDFSLSLNDILLDFEDFLFGVVIELGEFGLVGGFGLDFKGFELEYFFLEVLDLEFEVLPFGDELLVLWLGLLNDLVDFFDLIVESLDLAQEFDVFLLGFAELVSEDFPLVWSLIDELFCFLFFLYENKLMLDLFLLYFLFGLF